MILKNNALIILILVLFSIISLFLLGAFDDTSKIKVDKTDAIYFTNVRPGKSDSNVVACIPAAYSTENGSIIGHYSVGKGRKGSSSGLYTTIHLDNNAHFQQVSLVRGHKAKTFKDKRLRYRRALCKKGADFTIEQSKYPTTLNAFARSLTKYDNAWNLDMGTYSYGWYRKDGRLHYLGASTFWNRHKQTNWIVIRKE